MNDQEAVAILVIENGLVLGFAREDRVGYSLPCGKIIKGEELKEAGARECLEETGVTVRILDDEPFITYEHTFLVTTFKAVRISGELRSGVEGTPKWVTATEIANGHFSTYNRGVFDHFGVNWK
jgi:8-oxo-dGTP pyrophosphatase MutT (NUDIX family)